MRVIGTTQVVVDSASYLPESVREQYGIVVVPLAVSLDGEPYREFVDLDAATFYERLAGGAKVSTSQPSPGEFATVFEAAQAAGAEQIVAVLIGSSLSGTINSARLAAGMVSIPVHIIDTGVASFIEGLCAWEACEVLAGGGTLEAAEAAAHAAAKSAGNVFIVKGLELLRSGGRMARDESSTPPAGVPVLALEDGAIRPKAVVTTVDVAMGLMVSELQAAIAANPGKRFRAGISNGAADELADILEARVRALPEVEEVSQYIIGPSVGAHTGPGCTGIRLPRPPGFARMMQAFRLGLATIAGYLVGSVLTADLVAGVARRRGGDRVDLRATGSGNPGAANVMANLGTSWGVAVLAGDILKGGAGAQAGRVLAGDAGAYLAATAAVAGHCFPVWSRFRGGKGVATSAGTTLVCFPAYIPVDVGLVGLSWVASKHAGKATAVASSAFVLAAFAWYRFGLPNAWGTKPTAGLPLYAAATSAIIGYKFLAAPAHAGNRKK